MANFKYSSAMLSDVGMKRKQNQDRALIRPDLDLYVVADGMGGHQGGETASRLCAESIEEVVMNSSKNTKDSNVLQQAVLASNHRIFEQSETEPTLRGMGTTVTILKISEGIATIAQVGDSRAYYWNELGIWQLTRDHSMVQEKLRAGLITREQMKTDGMKNVITRSVGYDMNLQVDIFTLPVEPGDGFLLCSDGLSGPLEEREMFAILKESLNLNQSLEKTSEQLVVAANNNGGEDNITVVLVRAI